MMEGGASIGDGIADRGDDYGATGGIGSIIIEDTKTGGPQQSVFLAKNKEPNFGPLTGVQSPTKKRTEKLPRQ